MVIRLNLSLHLAVKEAACNGARTGSPIGEPVQTSKTYRTPNCREHPETAHVRASRPVPEPELIDPQQAILARVTELAENMGARVEVMRPEYPDKLRCLLHRGRDNLSLRRYRTALREFDRLIAEFGDDSRVWSRRGVANAVVNMGGQIGGACAPLIAGMMLDRYGWGSVFLVMACGSAMTFLVLTTIKEPLAAWSED